MCVLRSNRFRQSFSSMLASFEWVILRAQMKTKTQLIPTTRWFIFISRPHRCPFVILSRKLSWSGETAWRSSSEFLDLTRFITGWWGFRDSLWVTLQLGSFSRLWCLWFLENQELYVWRSIRIWRWRYWTTWALKFSRVVPRFRRRSSVQCSKV